MDLIVLAWIIFAAVVVGLLLLNFIIVRYYNDRNSAETFPTIVAVLALTITLLCIFLIPVDIYSVSTRQSEDVRNTIKVLYLVMYCTVLSFAFGVIPFACFYYEAYDPESESPLLKRIWDGFKYTIGLIVIVIILLVVGIFIRSPNDFNTGDPPDVWAKKVLAEGKTIATIAFTIACVTLLGYVVWCTYTAYGLASLPIGLMKGKKSIKEDKKDIQGKIQKKQKEKNTVAKGDVARANLLADEERALTKQAKRLQGLQMGCEKLWACCRPFSVVFGVLGLLLSLLLVLSLALTAIDRTMNHVSCGATCGFILTTLTIFNPLDKLLLLLSPIFPVDYVILSLLVLYIYFCTLNAITDIGIRCFCLNMFKFRRGRTEPQALMTTAIILMLSTLALNNSIVTLAPTYANFGSQTYVANGTTDTQPCSISAPGNICLMTQVGIIVHSVDLNVGFFGIVFYAFTWLFVLAWFLSLIIAGVRARSSNVDEYSDDDEEEENW